MVFRNGLRESTVSTLSREVNLHEASWTQTVLFILLLLFLTVILTACSGCDNTVIKEVYSPDHRNKVVIFERSCGTTTGFSTQASLMRSEERLSSSSGGIFIADDNRGAIGLGKNNDVQLSVHWESNSAIAIVYPTQARVFKRVERWDLISISYHSR